MINQASLKKVLNETFGLSEFRPGQLKIIEQILCEHDVFAIMPTGAGKSICFQLPAILLSGVTIVVSPLVALMNDQVKRLQQLKIKAIFLNRSLTSGQIRKIMADTVRGFYKIIYIAPERLESKAFFNFVSMVKVDLVVIDEAHCVLQWGFGFRPSYLKIAQFFEKLNNRPVFAAFTATASLQAMKEIPKLLKLQHPFIFSGGFERSNLFFDVVVVKNDLKIKVLLKIFKAINDESTIVYCQTKKNVEMVCLVLKNKGFKVVKYHAGLSYETRRRNQASFLADEVTVLVATNSFGMGIDKKNVRNVVHFNMPKSLEDYYQEAGRAGRDGRPARCLIIFSNHDIEINRFLIKKSVSCGNVPKEQLLNFEKHSFEKLDQIASYCVGDSCYRDQILTYFGEMPKQQNCFSCGNCLRNFINLGEIAILIFRCLIDAGCCLTKTNIFRILKGRWLLSRNFKMNRVYGKAKEVSVQELKVCLEELVLKKLLKQVAGKRLELDESAFVCLKDPKFELWINAKKFQRN